MHNNLAGIRRKGGQSISVHENAALNERREAVVKEHIDAENRHDVDGIVDSFHHPRYEVMSLAQVKDGDAAVREMWVSFIESFPDLHIERVATYYAESAVIVEVVVKGTHRGTYLDIPPTNRRVNIPMACVFLFEDDRLVCERLYFDAATRLRQLAMLPPRPSGE